MVHTTLWRQRSTGICGLRVCRYVCRIVGSYDDHVIKEGSTFHPVFVELKYIAKFCDLGLETLHNFLNTSIRKVGRSAITLLGLGSSVCV